MAPYAGVLKCDQGQSSNLTVIISIAGPIKRWGREVSFLDALIWAMIALPSTTPSLHFEITEQVNNQHWRLSTRNLLALGRLLVVGRRSCQSQYHFGGLCLMLECDPVSLRRRSAKARWGKVGSKTRNGIPLRELIAVGCPSCEKKRPILAEVLGRDVRAFRAVSNMESTRCQAEFQ